MKKRRSLLAYVVVVSVVLLLGLVFMIEQHEISGISTLSFAFSENVEGGRTDSKIAGLCETIESHEVISFRYEAQSAMNMLSQPMLSADAFSVSCERISDGRVHIKANGGSSSGQRDGTKFLLDYEADEDGFLAALDALILEHRLSENNGHVTHVNGLPPYGDTLSVEYANGERIYRSNNQARMLNAAASDAIYEVFLTFTRKNGYDFTTAGSNVPVYDDADEAFLQGTWSGKHFGRDVKAVFTGSHVQIWYDGELTDDTEYVIIEGSVLPNRLRPDADQAYRPADGYERFHGVDMFTKYLGIGLTGYVYDGSSSTFTLRRGK